MANIVEMMREVKDDSLVFSVVSATSATPLDDGYVGKLNGLVSGNEDLWYIAVPDSVTTDTNSLVMVVGANVYKDSNGIRLPLHDKTDWTYVGTEAVRAYGFKKGMRIKINSSAISGTPTLSQYVIPQNSSFQLAAAANLSGGTTLAFVVEKTDAKIWTGKTSTTACILRCVNA